MKKDESFTIADINKIRNVLLYDDSIWDNRQMVHGVFGIWPWVGTALPI